MKKPRALSLRKARRTSPVRARANSERSGFPFPNRERMRLDEAAFVFLRADNKEIYNKAMQLIDNKSHALLTLCWQGCVFDSDKVFPIVLCGHPKSAGQESPKRTAPLNLRVSLTHNVRLRLQQGHFPLALSGNPTPVNWMGQILHHGMPNCNSLLRLSPFRGLISFAVAPTVTTKTPPHLSLERCTRVGAFLRSFSFSRVSCVSRFHHQSSTFNPSPA
jgi:hypothetical protein